MSWRWLPHLHSRLRGAGGRHEGRGGEDIDLTFPEDYHAKDLAGQPVQFKVKCVEVKEKKVPAIDDEFAKDVSEFETLAEFKEDLKQKIVEPEHGPEVRRSSAQALAGPAVRAGGH